MCNENIAFECLASAAGKRGSKMAASGETAKEAQLLSTISGLQAALEKAQNDQQAGVSNARYMQVGLAVGSSRTTYTLQQMLA